MYKYFLLLIMTFYVYFHFASEQDLISIRKVKTKSENALILVLHNNF